MRLAMEPFLGDHPTSCSHSNEERREARPSIPLKSYYAGGPCKLGFRLHIPETAFHAGESRLPKELLLAQVLIAVLIQAGEQIPHADSIERAEPAQRHSTLEPSPRILRC